VASLLEIRRELVWLTGRRISPGTIPERLQRIRRSLKRLVIPERRARTYPRAVKVKMSNYPRKRPSTTVLNTTALGARRVE
jgi:hypothetical protein